MEIRVLREMFRQINEGTDIPSPTQLVNRLTAEPACRQLPGMPYSLATNLAHTVFWQRLWLNRLRGVRAESITKDWRVPEADEWQHLRDEFLQGLSEAMRISHDEPLEHSMKSDEAAVKALVQIAIHNSYHIGQINLLKRSLQLHRRG